MVVSEGCEDHERVVDNKLCETAEVSSGGTNSNVCAGLSLGG